MSNVSLAVVSKTSIFVGTSSGGPSVALASLTVTAGAIFVYTPVRCPKCNKRVMDIPGNPILEVRVVKSENERSGRGPVVSCRKCHSLIEAVAHR